MFVKVCVCVNMMVEVDDKFEALRTDEREGREELVNFDYLLDEFEQAVTDRTCIPCYNEEPERQDVVGMPYWAYAEDAKDNMPMYES